MSTQIDDRTSSNNAPALMFPHGQSRAHCILFLARRIVFYIRLVLSISRPSPM